MSSFDLLNDKIKKYIWNQKWSSFRPIQESAIQNIIQSNDNYVLAAKTASGKTEAAFLPAINSIDYWEESVKVLYISPLIALINDQFLRIEQLCKYLDVKVTKWHGEASKSEKQKLIKNPQGILLITPESIEAMFTNHPEYTKSLFPKLEYIIIDEIHSFLGTLRGKHLQSLLERIDDVNEESFRFLGLSATLSNESYELVKKFVSNGRETKVILDKDKNKVSVAIKHYDSDTAMLPDGLVDELYDKTQLRKSLIFPNTRSRVEEVAVRLQKLSKTKNGLHSNYFSHHSSVDRELREFVERFAKTSFTQNFAISCTSTLELGIDIGSIDTVVQIDSTFSIASLVQRLGRSGRKTSESNLLLYTTNEWSLLQSIACIELYKEDYLEPVSDISLPYDVLLQQILSITKEKSGISIDKLTKTIKTSHTFDQISEPKVDVLLDYLIKKDILENLQGEVIIGLEGERIVNSKDFYSLFESEDNFKVEYNGNKVGELPLSPQIIPGENLFLAARIWKIEDIDTNSKRIYVKPAKDGKKPKFFGSGGEVHFRVRNKMLSILKNKKDFSYLDSKANEALKVLRKKFELLSGKADNFLPIFTKGEESTWYTFVGTKVNRSIDLLFKMAGYTDLLFVDSETSFSTKGDLKQMIIEIKEKESNVDEIEGYLIKQLEKPDHTYPLGKFGRLLPNDMKAEYLINNYYDFDATLEFLEQLNLE